MHARFSAVARLKSSNVNIFHTFRIPASICLLYVRILVRVQLPLKVTEPALSYLFSNSLSFVEYNTQPERNVPEILKPFQGGCAGSYSIYDSCSRTALLQPSNVNAKFDNMLATQNIQEILQSKSQRCRKGFCPCKLQP